MAQNSALKKITTRAKSIRKASPNTSWKSAIKKAGAEYRSGKKMSGVSESRKIKSELKKKKMRLPHGYATTKRKRVSGIAKNSDRQDRKTTHITIGAVKSMGVKILEEKLGWYTVMMNRATTKKAKRTFAKKIRGVKSEIRKFK